VAALAGVPAAASEPAGGAIAEAGVAAERASKRREEFELTNQARALLQSGNATGALRVLADAVQRFPGGVLGQEREVITIEALAASGQTGVARQRAADFLQSHPGSVHAARLSPFLSP
jgi:outer membrane protein assembly factor BamD (BamD/ComL family)